MHSYHVLISKMISFRHISYRQYECYIHGDSGGKLTVRKKVQMNIKETVCGRVCVWVCVGVGECVCEEVWGGFEIDSI
jgi:hypothetical protein